MWAFDWGLSWGLHRSRPLNSFSEQRRLARSEWMRPNTRSDTSAYQRSGPPSLTASVIRNSAGFAGRRVATRASRKAPAQAGWPHRAGIGRREPRGLSRSLRFTDEFGSFLRR